MSINFKLQVQKLRHTAYNLY